MPDAFWPFPSVSAAVIDAVVNSTLHSQTLRVDEEEVNVFEIIHTTEPRDWWSQETDVFILSDIILYQDAKEAPSFVQYDSRNFAKNSDIDTVIGTQLEDGDIDSDLGGRRPLTIFDVPADFIRLAISELCNRFVFASSHQQEHSQLTSTKDSSCDERSKAPTTNLVVVRYAQHKSLGRPSWGPVRGLWLLFYPALETYLHRLYFWFGIMGVMALRMPGCFTIYMKCFKIFGFLECLAQVQCRDLWVDVLWQNQTRKEVTVCNSAVPASHELAMLEPRWR